ncbi:MAG: hypothetical protein AAFX10_16485 [Pseudomonadota bacterium]
MLQLLVAAIEQARAIFDLALQAAAVLGLATQLLALTTIDAVAGRYQPKRI